MDRSRSLLLKNSIKIFTGAMHFIDNYLLFGGQNRVFDKAIFLSVREKFKIDRTREHKQKVLRYFVPVEVI